jgi:hypothetical protein
LAPDTLLLVRADAQLSDRALVPLEQFGLGGQRTVRGYRQDLLLVDKAFLASIELRYPILRVPELGGVLQVTPFFDFGTGSGGTSTGAADVPNSLASTGLGLLWQSERINARLDWGIPLVSVDSRRNSLQEDGLYFLWFIHNHLKKAEARSHKSQVRRQKAQVTSHKSQVTSQKAEVRRKDSVYEHLSLTLKALVGGSYLARLIFGKKYIYFGFNIIYVESHYSRRCPNSSR